MYDRLDAGAGGTDRGAARLLLHAMMHGRNVVDHVARTAAAAAAAEVSLRWSPARLVLLLWHGLARLCV